MEITCSGCNTKLNISDDKIPEDQAVRINCPKCKNKIIIEPQNDTNETFAEGETGKQHPEPVESQDRAQEDQSDDVSFEYYDESKLALVMTDDNIHDKIRVAVEEKRYKFIPVPTIREALLKLRFNQFDLMILAEGFDGQEIDGGPIMNYLNHLSMSSRRSIFLALIGDKYQTMDEMTAFALSVNMVVNTKDLGSFVTILNRGMSEHERFYRVFLDILKEEGKM